MGQVMVVHVFNVCTGEADNQDFHREVSKKKKSMGKINII